jgi:CheY-like chemotaxis protein
MAMILLVEDNDDVREMMAVTLELEGHTVETAANGREALEKLRTGVKPSLILMDLMMPVMNGWEFRQEIDNDPVLRQVPVVIISATTAELIHKTQAAAYLPKPLNMDQLLHLVGGFCGDCASSR